MKCNLQHMRHDILIIHLAEFLQIFDRRGACARIAAKQDHFARQGGIGLAGFLCRHHEFFQFAVAIVTSRMASSRSLNTCLLKLIALKALISKLLLLSSSNYV